LTETMKVLKVAAEASSRLLDHPTIDLAKTVANNMNKTRG
jgi:hypothetical protein